MNECSTGFTGFLPIWSLSNTKEFLNIALYSIISFPISFGPFFIVIVCFVVYLCVGMMSLLWILSGYTFTYVSYFRTRDKLDRWGCGMDFWKHLRRAMNGKIIMDGKHKPDTANKYIFAYHPHGAFPMTLAWLLNSTEFRLYYNIDNNRECEGLKDMQILMSSLAFYMPFVREMCIGAGGKEITKEILSDTLKVNKHVVLCPGGVAEMYLTPSANREDKKILNISTKHKGFIKYAIKYGRPVIPILSFGEQELFTVTKWSSSLEDLLRKRIDGRLTFPWFSGR